MIVIDCRHFSSREAAHASLAALLGFPAYYGGNLDALADCLSELGPTRICLLNTHLAREYLGDYGEALLRVLWDAAKDNPNFSVFPL